MITRSVNHRDCRKYRHHCFLTWVVLNLDLYSLRNQGCIRDTHWMIHWNDSFAGINDSLLDDNQSLKPPYPQEQSANQKHSQCRILRVGLRSLAANQYIKITDRDWLERRNQKLCNLTQQPKTRENQLNAPSVVLLCVTKDVSRSKRTLFFFCCFCSPWIAPSFFNYFSVIFRDLIQMRNK